MAQQNSPFRLTRRNALKAAGGVAAAGVHGAGGTVTLTGDHR